MKMMPILGKLLRRLRPVDDDAEKMRQRSLKISAVRNLQAEILKQFVCHKSSKVAEFGYIYAEILANLTGSKVAVLEIGQRRGETFKTLLDVLPEATIYGIDIGLGEYLRENVKATLENYSPRARPLVGDQTDVQLLQRIGSEVVQEFGGFDLVIDDGGHTMEQQQTSLQVLSGYMKPCGIYVIEDIETSYLEQSGGGELGKPGTTIDLMKGLIDVVNRDYIDGHYRALKRPRRNVGTYSLFPNDERISSVRIFPTCAVLYFGYQKQLADSIELLGNAKGWCQVGPANAETAPHAAAG